MTSRSPVRLLLAGVGIAAVLAAAGCAAPAPSSTTAQIPSGLAIEGYVTAGDTAADAVDTDGGSLDIVGISGVSITPEGGGVAASSSEDLALVKKAHAAGTKAELLVNNVDTAKGEFSDAIATAMLSDESNRQFVIAGLAGEVEHGGYDGIQLDLEGLSQSNADDLVSFASELRQTLPSTATISMALTPQTSPAGYLAAGYDLAELTASISRFVVLAYDEHTPDAGAAGPVGGLPWAQQAITALTALVPAKKIDLGVAGYGYAWKTSGTGGVITPARAREQAGSRAAWVAAQGEWTAKLADGTVLWWSDARSLTTRANYAQSVGLHGVALWQITTADPLEKS